MSPFIVSARKYRPLTFDAVIGQFTVTSTLKNAVRTGHVAHAYLFCGPRGVGKTTCARIFARTLNCFNPTPDGEACGICESCMAFNESRSFNIHELDAASNNSVDDIRSLVDQVRLLPQVGRYSIYIIDEVHMLSQAAFNAFLKTLEEPPPHAVFILATTEKHKIIPTVLSRCQIFDFNRIRVEDIVSHLSVIGDRENIRYEKEALNVIAVKADGAMRDALSIFDQLASFSGHNITYQEVIENLNVIDYQIYFNITRALLEHSAANVLLIFNDVLLKGFDGFNFVSGLSAHFRDLLVSRDASTVTLLEVSDSIRESYLKQASECSPSFLLRALEICSQCETAFRSSRNQRLHVELALLQICNLCNEKKNNGSDPDRPSVTSAHSPAPLSKAARQKAGVNEPRKGYATAGRSISIKEALRQSPDPEETTEGSDVPEPQPVTTALSYDFLVMCWNDFTEQIRENRPRMAAALKNIKPVITENDRLLIHLNNQAQLEDFNSTTKVELEKFLKRELQHPALSIEAIVNEDDDPSKIRLYTSEEKFEFLNKKNPLLAKLKQNLNLELE